MGGDWLSVEFVHNVDVGVVNGGNRSGGGCSCNGSAELVGVSSALGSLIVASCGLGCVLQVPSAGHSHVVDVFDVARVDGVYAIPYGSVDGVTGTIDGGGGSQDKHVEVEE